MFIIIKFVAKIIEKVNILLKNRTFWIRITKTQSKYFNKIISDIILNIQINKYTCLSYAINNKLIIITCTFSWQGLSSIDFENLTFQML